MENGTGQASTEDCSDTSHRTSLVQLKPAEQWVPVSSPSATTPVSPARKELNKSATTYGPVVAVADGYSGKAAAPDTFMLLPSVQDHKLITTASSGTCDVDNLNIGYAPVDIRGKLLLDMKNTGGWRAALFIFGTIHVFFLFSGVFLQEFIARSFNFLQN